MQRESLVADFIGVFDGDYYPPVLHFSLQYLWFMWLCARAIAKCQHANRVISIIYPKWDQLGSPVKIILAFLT